MLHKREYDGKPIVINDDQSDEVHFQCEGDATWRVKIETSLRGPLLPGLRFLSRLSVGMTQNFLLALSEDAVV